MWFNTLRKVSRKLINIKTSFKKSSFSFAKFYVTQEPFEYNDFNTIEYIINDLLKRYHKGEQLKDYLMRLDVKPTLISNGIYIYIYTIFLGA